MTPSNTALPVIDWNYTQSLSSKAAGLTEDLLQMFMQSLPNVLSAINEAFIEKDMLDLHEHLHKLQGSATYCGMLRLADFVAQFSRALKQQTELQTEWLIKLHEETEAVKIELLNKGFKI